MNNSLFFIVFLIAFSLTTNAQNAEEISLPKGFTLKKKYSKKSKTSTVHTFDIQYNETTLFNHQVKLLELKNGNTKTYFTEEISTSRFEFHNYSIKSALSEISKVKASDEVIENFEPVYFKVPQGGFACAYDFELTTATSTRTVVINAKGEILYQRWNQAHNKPDTTVAIQIFKPDPITSAKTEYGLSFQDFNDSSSVAILNEHFLDSINLQWDSNTLIWKLQNDHIYADDFAAPFISPDSVVQAKEFLLTRSQNGFEYFNAFYYLNKTYEEVLKLGFDSLIEQQIAFDTYGSLGDQSAYIPSSTQPRLQFGTGGVDDAEDADVVVHEFGHAITWAASPESNFGHERRAIDEGFCDFLAYANSLDYSNYDSLDLFNWDGHNEYWTGREIPRFKTYPSDLKYESIYVDGGVYTSALKEISDVIGVNNTKEIAIESAHWFFGNMLMTDAGQFLMLADTLLNNAENTAKMKIVLCNKGLLPGCEDTLVNELPISNPYIGNLEGFANGEKELFLYPNKTNFISYNIFSLSGKLVAQGDFTTPSQLFYEITPILPTAGLYLLQIETNEGMFSFKLLKH